jgi:type 2 lantibiotic biosynthesis protein LanM
MLANLPAEEYKQEETSVSLEKALESIVSRASSLYERLDYLRNPNNIATGWSYADSSPEANAVVQKRLENWCKLAANSEQTLFEKRLAWENLDENSVQPYLAPGFRLENGPAYFSAQNITGSNWVDILANCLQLVTGINPAWEKTASFLKAETPFPFEEILEPFVAYASQALRRKTPEACALVSGEAWKTLELNLLERLSSMTEKTLYLEFSIFRAKRPARLSSLLNSLSTGVRSKPDQLYRQFVEKLLSGGLVDFFVEYSVLARRLATTIGYWIDATAEFLNRLAMDYPALEARFSPGQAPGQVSQIKLGISDLHNHGRSVICVTFESDLKLVYKPKPLELELVFGQFLDWCNSNGLPLRLKTLQVLTRRGYGWVEFAEHLPCPDRVAAGRFFKRMGMLIALAYALEGCDFHCENIIASGEHPVLVDLETLFYPFVPADKNFTSDNPDIKRQNLAFKQLWNTVFNTGFLPAWSQGPNKQSYDVSGLGGNKGQETSFQVTSWQDLNSDGMQLEYRSNFLEGAGNLPELNGETLKSEDYVEEIQAGFDQMYRFLIEKRPAILGEGGPLSKFKSLELRFVFRATRTYYLRIKKTLQPEFLRDGVDCSLELDGLSRPLLYSQTCPDSWSVLRQEHQAMFNMDIPLLTAQIDSADLQLNPGQTIKNFFSESGYQAVTQKIGNLSPQDLQRQLNIIQAAFFSRQAGKLDGERPRPEPALMANLPEISGLTQIPAEIPGRSTLIEAAISLADKIMTRAILSETGSAEWMELAYHHPIGRYNVKAPGSDLYGGTPGIALFLAALDHYAPGRGYRTQALAAIQSERHLLHHSSQYLTRVFPIGGMTGIGSVVYALVKLSELLNDESMLEDARTAASLITPPKIADDTNLDVLSGAAGSLLALIALYKRSGQEQFLSQAEQCGQHLLKNLVETPNKMKSWATLDGKFLTGFSHGAAGIAYALTRLYQETENPLFLQAARQGLEYERSLFSQDRRNWPDLRTNPDHLAYVSRWCHGAAGIGLSRLGIEKMMPDETLRDEIEAALASVLAEEWEDTDHACCGKSGRISFLFEAAAYLKRPYLAKEAAMRQAKMLELAKQHGGFQLFPMLPRTAFNPSFMQGVAGIGYELLRSLELRSQGIEKPDGLTLPAVLLLD